ncbi:phospholipase [Blastopirellula marina]|uniref:Phospholipase n=2 Tax=Blastopirellula marina TaxID=124 RepID=A0A2S8GRJ2_9BACT|nr:phospholipase [Blastopirellula marina]
MADYSELDELAAKHHFILAYPAGIRGSWRVPMPDAPNANVEEDIQLFDALVEQISAQHAIDHDRIYVVGMSQGAIFAQWLASQRPDEIAAVAAHSGSPPKVFEFSTAKVSTLLIAGQEDLVHDSMRDDVTQYQAAGCEAKFLSIPNLGHAWSAAHNKAIWDFLSRHVLKSKEPD